MRLTVTYGHILFGVRLADIRLWTYEIRCLMRMCVCVWCVCIAFIGRRANLTIWRSPVCVVPTPMRWDPIFGEHWASVLSVHVHTCIWIGHGQSIDCFASLIDSFISFKLLLFGWTISNQLSPHTFLPWYAIHLAWLVPYTTYCLHSNTIVSILSFVVVIFSILSPLLLLIALILTSHDIILINVCLP